MSGQILFYDIGVEQFEVVAELARLGYQPILPSGPLVEKARARGMEVRQWNEFIAGDLAATVERETARIARELQEGVRSPSARSALGIDRVDWVRWTGKSFLRQAVELAAQQVQTIEIFEAIRQATDLRAIVLGCDNSPMQRALVLAARRRGIPTIQLAHAIFGHSHAIARVAGEMHTLYSDFICVFGDRARRDLLATGTPDDRIRVTGAPHWDRLYSPAAQLDRAEACRRLGLDPNLPVVLYAAGYSEGSSPQFVPITRWLDQAFRSILAACRSVPGGAQLVVRPHPHELRRHPVPQAEWVAAEEALRSWAREQGQPIAHVSLGDKLEAFRACDVAIAAAGSTVIPELMILDRDVIGASIFPDAGLLYGAEDGVAIARQPSDLPAALRRLLGDAEYREQMRVRRKRALPDLNVASDGQASRRAAEAVAEIAVEARRSKQRRLRSLHSRTLPRVLLAAHDFFPFGKAGTERYTRDLGRALIRRGYDVRVVHPRPVLARAGECRVEEDMAEGLPVIRLLTPAASHHAPRLDFIKPALERILKEHRIDLVHMQHFMGLGVSFIETVRQAGIPLIATANDFWPLCEQVHLMHPTEGVCTGPATIDKCVQCARRRHPMPEEQIPQVFYLLADRHYSLKRALADIDLMICPSRFLYDVYERNGFATQRLVHLPQGAALTAPLPPARHENGRVVFSYLGHIAFRKGLDLLVRAFNEVDAPSAELRIHGINAEPRYLEQVLASVQPGRRVTYHGEYTPEEMPAILAETDVAVVPSRGENFPFVIREILHHGVPVVATDLAGIPEIVVDGVNGRLFPPENHQRLGEILRELAGDQTHIERLRGGITSIKTMDEDAADIETLYQGILADRAGQDGINIVLVAPGDKAPSLDREEFARNLAAGFVHAGLPAQVSRNRVQPSAVNLFIGFEQLPNVDALASVRKIALALDPVDGASAETVDRLRRADEIWSLSAADVDHLRRLGSCARLLPIGSVGGARPRIAVEQEFDVLFEGTPTPRQERILKELEAFCEVARVSGARGPLREDLYLRAKIVLHLLPEESASIDHARILSQLDRGAFVVAEESDDETFGSALVTAPAEHLPEVVRGYLAHADERTRRAEETRAWLADRPLSRLLREWLEGENPRSLPSLDQTAPALVLKSS